MPMHSRLGRLLRLLAAALVLAALGLAGMAVWLHRRALPQIDGRVQVAGLNGPVEILRDRWGVPHVVATRDEDAYFGLGFAAAQDRLFQLELFRHVGQGRLSELFGPELVKVDHLFRAVDFQGIGRRRLAAARPDVRAAFDAYARGINAAVASGAARRPVELTLLGRRFAPAASDDFVGVLGYMCWTLQTSWDFDPIYEDLVAKVGEERARSLFPYTHGGEPPVHPAAPPRAASRLRPTLFALDPPSRAFLERLPRLCASNTWAVAPGRSASGHALLANDPHLDIGLPSLWYHAHLKTPAMDVVGATIPGLPFVIIGHNRDVAWGLTNVMLDAGDFFLEKVRSAGASEVTGGEVLSRGAWTPLASRRETIAVKGGPAATVTLRRSPHGPLVSDLLAGRREALAFRWTYDDAADETNDFEAFRDLNRASDWPSFRAAAARMGGVAQNVAYADRAGHIAMVTTGAIPRRVGRLDGMRFRVGWDGSEEWDGLIPFDERRVTLDPPEGVVAAANNPPFAPPAPYYVSAQWEPLDRILRIRERLAQKPRLTLADMQALQQDILAVSGRELVPFLREAYAQAPPREARVREALGLFAAWDGRMSAESPAAALCAALYKHLFHELLDDELGPALTAAYRAKANISAVMIRTILDDPASPWIDRVDTPEREDRAAVLRRAFEAGVAELQGRLGGEPGTWAWGRIHTLTLTHPLGAVRLLAPYFNLGPYPMPGHALTVFKEESRDDFRIHMGPSLRQVVDLGDLSHGLAVLPGGQSGVRASPHYGDLFALWRAGEYHPLLSDPADLERELAARLSLEPAQTAGRQ